MWSNRMNIRLLDSAAHTEFQIDRRALIHSIVHGQTIRPTSQVWWGDRWEQLNELPDRPWLGEMVRLAAKAIRIGDVARVEQFADRILEFGAPDDQREEVRYARFMQGCLRMSELRWQEAVWYFETARRGSSNVLAAAVHNNLAVAWALLRNAVAALKHFDLALAADPGMLVSHLSMRIFAENMLAERAVNIPGHATWKEIAVRASDALRRVSPSQVRDWMNPHRSFPSYSHSAP